jgi:hypothetical protein
MPQPTRREHAGAICHAISRERAGAPDKTGWAGVDNENGANSALGFDAQFWAAADKMRGRVGDIAVYRQESNLTACRRTRMNLAICGIDTNLGQRNADSFRQDLHPDLKADIILANPP